MGNLNQLPTHFTITAGVYSEFIPTRWLSEDFEETLKQDWAQYLTTVKTS